MSLPYLHLINDNITYSYADRVIVAKYGYNYTQNITDGLAARTLTVTLTIGPLTDTQHAEFYEALISLDIDTPFVINLPGKPNMTVRYVKDSYTEVFKSYKLTSDKRKISTKILVTIQVKEVR
jgi:hypothetical protein